MERVLAIRSGRADVDDELESSIVLKIMLQRAQVARPMRDGCRRDLDEGGAVGDP